jgi:hypothetical protein
MFNKRTDWWCEEENRVHILGCVKLVMIIFAATLMPSVYFSTSAQLQRDLRIDSYSKCGFNTFTMTLDTPLYSKMTSENKPTSKSIEIHQSPIKPSLDNEGIRKRELENENEARSSKKLKKN